MNKLRLIKGKALRVAVMLSALFFAVQNSKAEQTEHSDGMHSDLAAVQTVQQQESISGTVVDNTGEAVIAPASLWSVPRQRRVRLPISTETLH